MTLTVYDLCGADDLRFSPNCWRTRMAIAHKGLEATYEAWRFTEKDRLTFCNSKTVPVLVDEGEAIVNSWAIASHLEDHYPDRPSLFGGVAGRAVTGFINAWADSTLHPALVRCLVPDVYERLDPVDKDYFRESREARFGVTIEELRAKRPALLATLDAALSPLRTILAAEQWIAGDAPAYADYIVFGAFQWARLTSPIVIVKPDDPIHPWRERMLDLFGGLARGFRAAA